MRHRMISKLYTWRFYGLEREEYEISMNKILVDNLSSLSFVSLWFAIFAFIYSALLLFTPNFAGIFLDNGERAFSYGIIYVFVGIVSVLISLFCKRAFKLYSQTEKYNKKMIYAIAIIIYAIVMVAGIHVSVWTASEVQAIAFPIFLISVMLSITLPPTHNLLLLLPTAIIFAISTVLMKSFDLWLMDLIGLTIAIPISIAYAWYISQYRLLANLNSLKLKDERNRFHSQSIIDELTQLKNRRDFDNKFSRYLTDYREKDNFLCLAIADIDYFKEYNDHYGHLGGDECLRTIGSALLLPWDNKSVYTARIGGEEFALLWFEEEKADAQNIVLQLHKRVNDLKIPHAKSTVSEYVSLSIGVCIVQSKNENNAQDTIYSNADKALYEAKKDGRNQAVIFDGDKKY